MITDPEARHLEARANEAFAQDHARYLLAHGRDPHAPGRPMWQKAARLIAERTFGGLAVRYRMPRDSGGRFVVVAAQPVGWLPSKPMQTVDESTRGSPVAVRSPYASRTSRAVLAVDLRLSIAALATVRVKFRHAFFRWLRRL